MDGITQKQRKFIEEYIIDYNGTKAAIRAGYSKRTARQQANQNLSKPQIKSEIEKYQQEAAQRAKLTKDDVLQRLVAFIDSNPLQRLRGERGFEILERVPEAEAKFLSVETHQVWDDASLQVVGVKHIVRGSDSAKLRAIEMLGRHLGMFTDKLEVSGTFAISERLESARRRAHAIQS